MDPVTHGLVGVTQGVMLSKGRDKPLALDNPILWASVLGNVAPDIDIIIRFFYGELIYLKYHRVFTHSIPLAIVMSGIIALGLNYLFPKVSKRVLFIVTYIGMSFHVFFDVLTSYGTQALWPFIRTRMAWDILMIIDPLIILLIMFGLILIIWKKWPPYKTFSFITVLLVLYIGSRAFIHYNLDNLVTQHYAGEGIKKHSVLPGVFGVNQWKFVIETPLYYKIGEVSFTDQKLILKKIITKNYNDRVIQATAKHNTTVIFKEFARYPYYQYQKVGNQYIVHWYDLRYNYANRYPYTIKVLLTEELKITSAKLIYDFRNK